MTGLDILTQRGQQTVCQEDDAAALLEARTGMQYIRTPKSGPAYVDAVLMRHGHLFAVAEMKCRNMSASDLLWSFDNEWLVTYEKVRRLCEAARLLGVPGVGLLYLVPERKLLAIRICDESGGLRAPLRLERTETQATVNGGRAIRVNAYIRMTLAKEYE